MLWKSWTWGGNGGRLFPAAAPAQLRLFLRPLCGDVALLFLAGALIGVVGGESVDLGVTTLDVDRGVALGVLGTLPSGRGIPRFSHLLS